MEIDFNRLPSHIAIIMDGNGRWAKKRFLSRKIGHKMGADALERIVKYANKIGIKHLTVYAFSTENWKRSEDEVDALMNLLRDYLDDYISRSETDNIKIDIIGSRDKLAEDICKKIDILQEKTKNKDGLSFHIALNYGSRDEILRAVKKLANDVKNNSVEISDISEEMLSTYLDTKEIPDPELLIRTSGEERISNFLLWQIAYSEFYFTDVLWPDFKPKDLDEAIISFQNRDRRFGGRNEVVK